MTRIPDFDDVLAAARAAQRAGLHVAGYLAYEAGFALESKLATHLQARPPHPDSPLPVLLLRELHALDAAAGQGAIGIFMDTTYGATVDPTLPRQAGELALAGEVLAHVSAARRTQPESDFAVAYALGAMPARYALERRR